MIIKLWLLFVNFYRNKKCYNKKNQQRLKEFKDKYAGKRCFIVGNGPSLCVEDLNKIMNEYSFGANRIHVLFDKTQWRPTFYLCQDSIAEVSNKNAIKNTIMCQKFIRPSAKVFYKKAANVIYYNISNEEYTKKEPPLFSDNICNTVYEGFTVTYSMLQFAAYMGFSEIYLIGVDCNYSSDNKSVNVDSYSDSRMFTSKYAIPDIEYNILAYKSAKEYVNKNNIRILNATRGGKLEIFDRINFDDIFKKERRKKK